MLLRSFYFSVNKEINKSHYFRTAPHKMMKKNWKTYLGFCFYYLCVFIFKARGFFLSRGQHRPIYQLNKKITEFNSCLQVERAFVIFVMFGILSEKEKKLRLGINCRKKIEDEIKKKKKN